MALTHTNHTMPSYRTLPTEQGFRRPIVFEHNHQTCTQPPLCLRIGPPCTNKRLRENASIGNTEIKLTNRIGTTCVTFIHQVEILWYKIKRNIGRRYDTVTTQDGRLDGSTVVRESRHVEEHKEERNQGAESGADKGFHR